MRMRVIAALIFLSVFTYMGAQENNTQRNSFISAGALQIKESANFGLVFTGPSVNYGMAWNFKNENRLINYEYEVGIGILFSRKIPALGFYLKPVDLAYLFKLPLENGNLFLGPLVRLEYNYNLYPDLQAGFDYWFMNSAFGVSAVYDFNYQNSAFRLKMNSSLAGFTSRQEYYRDPYFYDLGFKHAINHLNSGFSFGSFDRFATLNFEVLWRPAHAGRMAFGYVMNYSGYYRQPEISIVSHCFKLIINRKIK